MANQLAGGEAYSYSYSNLKGKDYSMAILEQKKVANQHLVDEASNDDNSVVSLHPATLEKLHLFNAKTVLLKESDGLFFVISGLGFDLI